LSNAASRQTIPVKSYLDCEGKGGKKEATVFRKEGKERTLL
jgi:hypothetical protein